MSVFEHNPRNRIFNPGQHPYRHSVSEFSYANDAAPQVTNLEGALDWLFAVLYPNMQDPVAEVSDLPSVGNNLLDMRVVNDDGDGKAASYRWEQREGDVAAKWYKIYDMDWGEDSILSGFLLKTQDVYVYKYGYDDVDEDGVALTGTDAGQHIYGGASANTHLNLHANSGDGTGSQTGFVQFFDNVRPSADSTWSLGTTSIRWLKVWTDEITSGTLTLTGGSITDSSGAISFDNENLTTTGSFSAATVAGTTSGTFGTTLTLATGSITDSGGAISFGNENLTTTGTFAALSGTFGSGTNLVVAAGSITDASGAISFGDENLSTTGSVTGGQVNADNVRLDGNTVSATNTNGNLNLSANGTGVVALGSSATTGDVVTTGTITVTGQFNIDSVRIDGVQINTIPTNQDLTINPNGTGKIVLNKETIPGSSGSLNLGNSSRLWKDHYFSGDFINATQTITNATIFSLRDINVGVGTGYTIFWDGSKWVASLPDTEIDHGTLTGLADDDHTQYMLLAGRSGGQNLIGGTASGNNLTLESTSNVSKGVVSTKSNFVAFTDASYSGSWSGTNIGGSSNRFNNVYTAGEFIGLRLENRTSDPSSSSQNPGRLAYRTDTKTVVVDDGSAITRVNLFRSETDTVWNGSDTSKAVTVSGIDATKALWQLLDNTNDYERLFVSLKATSTTQVTITLNSPLPAGSYRLIGIQ